MLGRALCKKLAKDYSVTGLDIIKKGFLKSFIKGDITNKKELFSKVGNLKPQVIIHTASFTDVDSCELKPKLAFKINAIGSKYIAELAKKNNSFLIFISSDYVFSGEKKKPYKEIDTPFACNVYGESKIKAENYIKSILKNFLIIRTSRLFGAAGENFVDKIIKLAKRKKELRLVTDQISCPTYANDLAKAIEEIFKLETFPRGILHITNSGSCSWFEFARESLKYAKVKNIKLIPIHSRQFKRPSEVPPYSVLDKGRFKRLMKKSLRSWQQAVRDYLQ